MVDMETYEAQEGTFHSHKAKKQPSRKRECDKNNRLIEPIPTLKRHFFKILVEESC